MADFYTWNNKHSIERATIERFLSDAQQRIKDKPGRIPMNSVDVNLAINWLRGLLDLKPSEMTGDRND